MRERKVTIILSAVIFVFGVELSFLQTVALTWAQSDNTEVQRLVQLGEKLFKSWKYTNPPGEEANATQVFKKVLKLDPQNEVAKRRLAQMEAYYLRKVKSAKSSNDTAKLTLYYKKILFINADNKEAKKALGIQAEPTPTTAPQATPTPVITLSKSERMQKERYERYSADIRAKLEEAHALYMKRNREDQTPIVQAIKTFEQVMKMDPKNYDAYWQAARATIWYGDHAEEEKKIEIFSKGVEYAKKAIALIPNGVEAHYWYGSNLGKYGEARGIFKSLQYIDPILKEMNMVIKLDPQYYKAYTVLGILYRKAPPWPVSVGDIDKSEEYLRKSLAVNNKSLYAHLELGITFNKQSKWAEAKKEFNWVVNAEFEKEYIPENKEYKAEAKEILMMIKRRGL